MRIIAIVRSGLALIATLFWTSLAIVTNPVWRRSVQVLQLVWSRNVLWLAGVKVEVTHEVPIEPPVIFVANHQSSLDILTLLAHMEGIRFVAKIELRKAPFIGRCMLLGGHIFLDRGKSRETVRALRKVGDEIRETGRNVVIFPEGTRFADGELGPFKRGALLLARTCRLPLVPVGIANTPDLMPPDAAIARAGRVEINVGSPLDVNDWKGRDAELIARLREEVARLARYPEKSPVASPGA